MASGTVGSTSTYSGGKGISFAKDIASRVVDAAEAAKKEKKHQQSIIDKGGEVPEKDRKGLFVKALKQEFISNPINDIKKSFNKKVDKVGRVAGLFGSKGEKLQQKLSGKKLKTKSGFDRSGYVYNNPKDDDETKGGTGGGGSGLVTALGELVLDIQQIAAAVTSMQGLVSTQMNMSLKMSDSLEQIKSALIDQVSLQQEQIDNEEMAAREANLEASQQTSATSKGSSTFTEGGFDLIGMFAQLQSLFGIIKSLPGMFTGLLKGILSKIPGGKFLMGKFAGKAAGETAEAGAKGFLGKFLRPIFKRIPVVGGLIDFAVSLALGESVGRAAAKAAGATLGAALGGIVGSILPGPGTFVGGLLGGIAGDWVGSSLYDAISGAFGGKKEEKMAAGGGVMIGEAGPEMVTGLQSANAKKQLGGLQKDKGIDEVQDTYYSALAGSTLAITKDFVEGLGPVGAAVSPIIQDDVAKLGRQFDVPATATKVSVGGLGLREDPQAAKKGENYLKELVKGTLEKLSGKKDKDKNKNKGGGDSSSSSGSDGTPSSSTNPNNPTAGGKNDLTFGDSIASGLAGRQGANQQTVMDDKGVSKVGAAPADVLGQLQSFDKSKLKGKTVRLSTGITNNPSDLTTVEEQIKYLVSVGAKVQLVGVTNTPPTAGQYAHVGPQLKGMNEKLKGIADKYSDKGVTFLGGFTPGADGIHPANASQLNSSYSVDVLPGGKVGAAAGAKIDLWATSSAGNAKLNSSSAFRDTKTHAHRPGPSARGWPRDYAIVKPGVDPVANPNAGKGEPVVAGVSGKVKTAENLGGNAGNTVQIADSSGNELATFHHFDKIRTSVGASVSPTTVIGTQGNTGTKNIHVHLEGKEEVHTKWIRSMLGGNYSDVGDYDSESGDGEEETMKEESPQDMFDNIAKALTGITSGLAMMRAGELGLVKTEEDYSKYEKEFNEAFAIKDVATPTGSTTTPTTSTPTATPAAPAGGGMNGARGSGASPVVQVQSTATPSESRSRDARPSPTNTAHSYTPAAPV